VHGAQPGGGELRGVAQEQQHALAGGYAKEPQRARRARHIGGKLGIAERLVAAEESRARAVAGQRGISQQVFNAVDGGGKIV